MSDATIVIILCVRRTPSVGITGIPTIDRRSPYDRPTASPLGVL